MEFYIENDEKYLSKIKFDDLILFFFRFKDADKHRFSALHSLKSHIEPLVV